VTVSSAIPTIETPAQLVVFAIGDDQFAVPITRVQEIIRYTKPRTVSSGSPCVAGVISLRGAIVPVCDLGHTVGAQVSELEQAKIVIAETAGGTAGILVDAVDEVIRVDDAQLDVVPGADGTILGVAKLGERLVMILDVDAAVGDVHVPA
jgi:purine-binding chemotaxis protein CheW